MNTDTRIALGFALIYLVVVLPAAWWWVPLEWSACQKLYDNKPAQVICLLSR